MQNEFSRKPAHAVPNWQALNSTGNPAGQRGAARSEIAGSLGCRCSSSLLAEAVPCSVMDAN